MVIIKSIKSINSIISDAKCHMNVKKIEKLKFLIFWKLQALEEEEGHFLYS